VYKEMSVSHQIRRQAPGYCCQTALAEGPLVASVPLTSTSTASPRFRSNAVPIVLNSTLVSLTRSPPRDDFDCTFSLT
jgi:hypothetical protein